MDRLELLEEKVAHLMRAVEDLSDMVAAQGSEVTRLTRLVGMLADREAEREISGDLSPANVRPPHW